MLAPTVLIVYISAGQGSAQPRYFEFVTPLVAALGAAGIVQSFRWGGRAQSQAVRWLLVVSGLGGVACFVLGAPKLLCSLSAVLVAAGMSATLRQLDLVVPPLLVRAGWALLWPPRCCAPSKLAPGAPRPRLGRSRKTRKV